MTATDTSASDSANDAAPRMILRRPPFAFPHGDLSLGALHWNAARPEFSQLVNAASLAMPYLEPYLIRTMRMARPLITDPQLARELDLYCAQESSHFRQHRRFNDELKAASPAAVTATEDQLAEDYAWLEENRSLKFNLAYAEGFESMALAIGHMLIADRDFLFGGADSAVSSLVLWHFAEEIEHKSVTFDVFDHLHHSTFWRLTGLFYATGHIFWRTRAGYHRLLKADGLWYNWRSRLTLLVLLARIFARLLPRLARALSPGYHPRKVADPAWMQSWVVLAARDADAPARLDTTRLDEPAPVSL
ncbi:MAG: metal-dependent hydrolase [Parvibaculaceae bacterium]